MENHSSPKESRRGAHPHAVAALADAILNEHVSRQPYAVCAAGWGWVAAYTPSIFLSVVPFKIRYHYVNKYHYMQRVSYRRTLAHLVRSNWTKTEAAASSRRRCDTGCQ